MNRRILVCASVLGIAFLAGCASGPKFSEISKSIAPIPAGDGRIYFFRSSAMMGAALQPDIRLNGQIVGTSKPGGFFYVDEPAGSYAAATSNDEEKPTTFTLDVGETRYLRTSPTFGLLVGHVLVEVENPAKAKAEIETLSLSGRARTTTNVPVPPSAAAAPANPEAPAGPTTLASVIAAAQTSNVDALRHLDARSLEGAHWSFPSWNTQTYRDVHLTFHGGKVEAINQRDHTSGTYTVAGDKVCVDLVSRAWGKTCYVVIEATTGEAAHGLQIMAIPGGDRLPLTIR